MIERVFHLMVEQKTTILIAIIVMLLIFIASLIKEIDDQIDELASLKAKLDIANQCIANCEKILDEEDYEWSILATEATGTTQQTEYQDVHVR